MASRHSRRVYTAPLHVTVGADGEIVLFLPNGDSVALTVEAAARSSVLMSQAVSRARPRGRRESAKVIAVDFIGHALSA